MQSGLKLWPNPHVWTALGAIAAIDLTWLSVQGREFLLGPVFIATAGLALTVVFAAMVWIRDGRLRAVAIGSTFVMVAWPVLRLFNHLVMTTAMPMQDALLAQGDAILGFDWLGYAHWLDRTPVFADVLSNCYNSLTVVSCFAFLAIVLAGDLDSAGDFIGLFFVAAVLISSLGMFFPADGAMVYFAASSDTLKHISNSAGTWFVAPLHEVRTNPHHVFMISSLPGLTAFPSFHTAMGIIVLYCCRTRMWLFIVALVYVPLMIAAAVVFGGHYFVDIIAGVAITVGLITVLRRWNGAESRAASPAPELAPSMSR